MVKKISASPLPLYLLGFCLRFRLKNLRFYSATPPPFWGYSYGKSPCSYSSGVTFINPSFFCFRFRYTITPRFPSLLALSIGHPFASIRSFIFCLLTCENSLSKHQFTYAVSKSAFSIVSVRFPVIT
nr:MAG TPA: hypothetical protein [Caudoviricetes sp.]